MTAMPNFFIKAENCLDDAKLLADEQSGGAVPYFNVDQLQKRAEIYAMLALADDGGDQFAGLKQIADSLDSVATEIGGLAKATEDGGNVGCYNCKEP